MSEPLIVGIRHHSPACARLVKSLIESQRPRYVLIEGPADFNDRVDELLLAHQLPVAIYSYCQYQDGAAPGRGQRYGNLSCPVRGPYDGPEGARLEQRDHPATH